MINPPALLRWNGDKAYLAELANAASRPCRRLRSKPAAMPTLRRRARRFGSEWLVIKPPVSASAMGTHRLGPERRPSRETAAGGR